MLHILSRPARRLRAALAVALALACGPALALDPLLAIGQLHHDAWTSKDGMPGDVWEMTQDTGGFIWFATPSGLYRFDGVRFEHIRSLGGTPLLSNVIATVRAFPDGALWIGYRFAGLGVFRDGRLRHFAERDGIEPGAVYSIVPDERGRTWAATSHGLFMLDGARWHKIGADWGLAGTSEGLRRDPGGRLWVNTENALYYRDPGADRFVPAGLTGQHFNVMADRDGHLWLWYLDRVMRLPERLATPPRPRDWWMTSYSFDAIFDRDGNLWQAGCDGLCRLGPDALARVDTWHQRTDPSERAPSGLVSGDPMTMFEDREGNVWVGTRRGVDRFRRDRVVSLGLPDGYSYVALALDDAGRVWTSAESIRRPRLWTYGAAGLEEQPERDVRTLATAADGALLVVRPGVIERRKGGTTARIAYPDSVPQAAMDGGVRILLDDGSGLWAGFAYDSLYRYADGRWHPAHDYGLPDTLPISMARGADGTLWFGYRDSTLLALRDGKVRRFGGADGLDVGVVGRIHDAGGVLLAAGDKGLAMLSGSRFLPVRLADPQAAAGITGMLLRADGDLWLNGSRGLVRIPAARWRAFLRSPAGTISGYDLFDAVDGYPGIAQFRSGQSSLLETRDGRLWLAGTDGAAWIDPARLPRNDLAPPVHIVGVAAGGRSLDAGARLDLPAGTQDLQIAYTAPSFTMPERVRFRYRLDGVDDDWRDAGTRRTAYYTRLGPGRYRFVVSAANEDGVWNAQGAALDVTVAPTFVQGAPFKVLCAAAFLFGAWLLYRLRLRRATRSLRRLLQERAGERERIARTLHDTLMQSVQALLMLFEHARGRLPQDCPDLPLLDRTLEQARAALREGRDELTALRGAAAPAQDLVGALVPLGHILGEQFGVRFAMRVDGQHHALCRDVAQEACFIAREALQNAFRHARANEVTLEVTYGEPAFELAVRDDGRGITQAARPGHWGLAGMRERAAAIGGRLDIGPASGAAGGGTLVALTVPASQAYERPARRPWWRRLARGVAAGRS
jgi:signal transduction histidine kinase/ligand-binding sensor domain-containing protein